MNFNWKRKRYLILIILVLILLFAINTVFFKSKDSNNFNKKVEDKSNIGYLPISSEIANVSTALLNESGKVEDDTIYYINSNEQFQKFINVGNFVDFKRDYKILTFIDYEKEEFYVDDKLVNDFDFILDKQEDIQIPVKLPKLDEGLHDVIFAIIKEPNDDLDDEYRCATEETHTIYIRFNIVVENEEHDEINFTELTYNNTGAIPEIFLHEDEYELRQFPSATIKEGKFNFNMTIGNIYEDKVKECAVILLKDWEVIPNDINNSNILFLKINPKEKTTIPMSIDINEEGLHNINAILIEDPYQKVKYGNNGVLNSIRIGVKYE